MSEYRTVDTAPRPGCPSREPVAGDSESDAEKGPGPEFTRLWLLAPRSLSPDIFRPSPGVGAHAAAMAGHDRQPPPAMAPPVSAVG
jgi:hypothetical protein